jgi:DivIVA domain-containing protein
VILFFVLILVVLVGLTTAAVLGKIGGFLADATTSNSFSGVPPGPISTEDIEQLHFDQALRGYRMNQVDEVLDALCVRVSDLESEVATLSVPVGAQRVAQDVLDTSGEPPTESQSGPRGEPKSGSESGSGSVPESEPESSLQSESESEPQSAPQSESEGEPQSESQK